MMFDAVIFDMDGVLLDSEWVSKQCWAEAAEEFAIDNEEFRPAMVEITGANSAKAREVMDRRFSRFPAYSYDTFRKRYEEIYAARLERGDIALKPYVHELLGWLQENHIPVALATSTNTQKVLREIQMLGIERYFNAVTGGDQVSRGKPDPEIYDRSRRSLGTAASKTFAVEDSYNGIRSASAAGLQAIMVPDILPVTEEMRQLAAVILPDLHAVRQYLSGLPYEQYKS